MSELSKRLQTWAKDDIVPGDLQADLLAAAEIVEAGEWQPIETAPKDEAVLVYRNCFIIAHFNSVAGRWIGYGWDSADTLNMLTTPPTHWRPLPSPPEVQP